LLLLLSLSKKSLPLVGGVAGLDPLGVGDLDPTRILGLLELDDVLEVEDPIGKALRAGDGAPLGLIDEVKGLEVPLVRLREPMGDARGLGVDSAVFEVKALMRVEILGLTLLTDEKADVGEGAAVVTGEDERSLLIGG